MVTFNQKIKDGKKVIATEIKAGKSESKIINYLDSLKSTEPSYKFSGPTIAEKTGVPVEQIYVLLGRLVKKNVLLRNEQRITERMKSVSFTLNGEFKEIKEKDKVVRK